MEVIDEGTRQSRGGIRRVVVVVPSFFTLANLFFGFWAIVSAFNGNFKWAGFFIVFAGVLDMLDGRIARLSKTGSRFGAELDSLVDVISFGIAPALVLYFLEFANTGKFGWAVCYLYVVAAALRLARYNVISHGKSSPSSWFTGLPSPAAGMTLATYYPFSQTDWYRASTSFLDLQHEGLTVLALLAGALMVSNVKYPRWPRIGFRSASGIFGLVLHLVIIAGAVLAPSSFLFPLGLAYMFFGIARSTILSLLDRGVAPIDESPAPDHLEAPTVRPLRPGRRRESQ
ncbi:MAG: CDP-diacylglycerol--serine O-phosphatidyltransferase [Gemmatimonadales bacterium]